MNVLAPRLVKAPKNLFPLSFHRSITMSANTRPLSVLVTGGGVAGPCFAWWLTKALEQKPEITVLERAPTPRTQGQSIDIRHTAVDIVKEMGLIDKIKARTTPEIGTHIIDTNGKPFAKFMQDGTNQGFTSEYEILRADLANFLIEETNKFGNINYVFGQRVSSISQTDAGADVTFTGDLGTQHYDLVVGADGTMSSTRPAIHGPDKPEYFKFLGAYYAFFSIPCDPEKDEPPLWRWYNTHGGRHLSTRPHNNPATTGAYMGYVMRNTEPDPEWERAVEEGPAAQKKLFRAKFQDAGWEAQRLLDGMETTHDFYMTPVKQVRIPKWSKGRCTLVGDAAYGPTFFTGMGTGLAIEGAYALAGEIGKLGGKDIPKALENYETLFRPFATKIQDEAPLSILRMVHPQSKMAMSFLRGMVSFIYSSRAYKLASLLNFGDDDDVWKKPEYKWVSV